MGYASIAGRARTSARSPRAHAICDRCGFRYNHDQLNFQMQWAGRTVINTQMLVCSHCLDNLQEQLRSIVIPPDPLPIPNPRPQAFEGPETNWRYTSGANTVDPVTGIPIVGGDRLETQDDALRVTQQTGEPPGGLNEQPGTDPSVPADIGGDDPGLPYGNDDVPETGPL